MKMRVKKKTTSEFGIFGCICEITSAVWLCRVCFVVVRLVVPCAVRARSTHVNYYCGIAVIYKYKRRAFFDHLYASHLF